MLIREEITPMQYSFCFIRLLYCVHFLLLTNLFNPIVISNLDTKSEHLRSTMSSILASESITTLYSIFIFLYYLPFGSANFPNLLYLLSKALTDLSNDQFLCKNQNAEEPCSPYSSKLKEPSLLDDHMPFSHSLPANAVTRIDSQFWIDDCVGNFDDVFLLQKNQCRLANVTLLDLHIFGRPLDEDEPIPRYDLVTMHKFNEDGSMTEVIEVLGQIINTRSFTVHPLALRMRIAQNT